MISIQKKKKMFALNILELKNGILVTVNEKEFENLNALDLNQILGSS